MEIVEERFNEDIIDSVQGINLTIKEIKKIKIFMAYELNGNLFSGIKDIYNFIRENFKESNRFIIIPFINKHKENLIIQKI